MPAKAVFWKILLESNSINIMLECPEQCQITKPGGFKIDTKTNLLLNVNDLVEIL